MKVSKQAVPERKTCVSLWEA